MLYDVKSVKDAIYYILIINYIIIFKFMILIVLITTTTNSQIHGCNVTSCIAMHGLAPTPETTAREYDQSCAIFGNFSYRVMHAISVISVSRRILLLRTNLSKI